MVLDIQNARIMLITACGLAVTAFGWGVVYNEMTTADQLSSRAIAGLESDLKAIRTQLPQIDQLQFQQQRASEQIAETKAATVETNRRVDRLVEQFGDKLDAIVDAVGKLSTRVEVLTTRVADKKTSQLAN
jgi:ABC-type transporter Mla subunit MlaD